MDGASHLERNLALCGRSGSYQLRCSLIQASVVVRRSISWDGLVQRRGELQSREWAVADEAVSAQHSTRGPVSTSGPVGPVRCGGLVWTSSGNTSTKYSTQATTRFRKRSLQDNLTRDH